MAEERIWIGTVPPVDVDRRAARIAQGFDEGTIVAFVLADGAQIVGELSLFGEGVASIGMCLAPGLRGRGWGGVLLDAALGHAARAGKPVLSLGVYAHNLPARRLYVSRGFVAVGTPEAPTRLDGESYEVIAMQRCMAGKTRRSVLERVADAIGSLPSVRRVAIDGTDGAGKTCFAAELAHVLTRRGTTVIRASVDGFHHPRAVRYRRGRTSPLGFFADSYDYEALKRTLLDPLSPGGDGRIRRAIHDVDSDESIEGNEELAPAHAVLLIDGIFLHREELRGFWDASIFLEVPFDVSIPRGASRGVGSPDTASPYNRRYVGGQTIYFERDQPWSRASIVVDNSDLDAPRIVRGA